MSEWRIVEGFPEYRVSDGGILQSNWGRGRTWHVVGRGKNSHGYHEIKMRSENGGRRNASVHVLVAEAFLGPKPFPDAQVRHKDGNQTHNAVANLAWGTAKENVQDMRAHGTYWNRGRHSLNDLSTRQAIRTDRSAGLSLRAIAKKYGVSKSAICHLVQGRVWSRDAL